MGVIEAANVNLYDLVSDTSHCPIFNMFLPIIHTLIFSKYSIYSIKPCRNIPTSIKKGLIQTI